MNLAKRNALSVTLLAVGLLLVAGILTLAPLQSTRAGSVMVPELGSLERDPGASLLPTSGTFAPVVEQASPAVVSITTSSVVKAAQGGWRFFGPRSERPTERRRRGAGSGVIVSPDGYVLTNHHVVEGAQEIEVALSDKRSFPARVVGSDSRTDIAILTIEALNLPVLPLGNSDNVRVGDIVLAIGNPFGIGKTVTMGIVGATGRGGLGIEDYEDFIQTDAAINPGNSGGALINSRGELVGINTAILSRSGGNQGVGFAVPVNMGHHVMSQILEHGEVRRGYLGVSIQDLTPAMAEAFGVPEAGGAVIGDVSPDGPAAEAGVRRGDVIVGIDGQPVQDARDLRLTVATIAPRSKVTFNVWREGDQTEVPITLGRYPESPAETAEAPDRGNGAYGLSVTELTSNVARQLGIPEAIEGVLVAGVDPGSRAAEAGVRRGDVIVEAGRRAVRTVAEFRDVVRRVGEDSLLLLVNRAGTTQYVILAPR